MRAAWCHPRSTKTRANAERLLTAVFRDSNPLLHNLSESTLYSFDWPPHREHVQCQTIASSLACESLQKPRKAWSFDACHLVLFDEAQSCPKLAVLVCVNHSSQKEKRKRPIRACSPLHFKGNRRRETVVSHASRAAATGDTWNRA